MKLNLINIRKFVISFHSRQIIYNKAIELSGKQNSVLGPVNIFNINEI
ncbi:MAG: hypothetical protein WCS13_07055 [Candidatus Cloacimonadaceae bacterium]